MSVPDFPLRFGSEVSPMRRTPLRICETLSGLTERVSFVSWRSTWYRSFSESNPVTTPISSFFSAAATRFFNTTVAPRARRSYRRGSCRRLRCCAGPPKPMPKSSSRPPPPPPITWMRTPPGIPPPPPPPKLANGSSPPKNMEKTSWARRWSMRTPPGGKPAPRGKPPPPPDISAPCSAARAPSFPNRSYADRLSLSERTSYASAMFLNFSAADASSGFLSGWYLIASLL
mmetsp:Transcript_9756/g.31290  ORF Transcript_9756/g.31290 Transcript_9756/m.31290 type:complete len:230 (+) Transcript_9756:1802-2491(+)